MANGSTTVVRLRRRGGQVVQDCDVYMTGAVSQMYMGGWKLPASDWANPFTVKECGSNRQACEKYESWLRSERPDLIERLPELQGKVLGCWCKPEDCHGDVLVRLTAEHAGVRKGSPPLTEAEIRSPLGMPPAM